MTGFTYLSLLDAPAPPATWRQTQWRQPELSTLTREFDPPRIDGLPKAQGEIHRSGIGPTEEPLIDGPEHQDLICSRSTRFEHCQDAASRFFRR